MAYQHTLTLCQWYRDNTLAGMTAARPSGVAAKIVQLGDISYYSARSISSILPVILIRPIRVEQVEATGLHSTSFVYVNRIVYVRKYSQSEDIVTDKLTDVGTIVEAIWADWNFSGLSLDAKGSQVESSGVSLIDYEPEEDIFATALDESLSAAAIEVEVVVHFSRKQT